MEAGAQRRRIALSKERQVRIFRRDGWLCCRCKKPVIFSPVMKLLELELRTAGHRKAVAYYHAHWTRDGAPLLDELGAVLDHVDAFSSGGPCTEENLCTSCAKCNGRKSFAAREKWDQREKRSPIKGKYGEPQNWDGLSTLFLVLAKRHTAALTSGERDWLRALDHTDS
jgi:HNH endonuclease